MVIVRHAQSDRNAWKDIATANGDFIYGGDTRDIDLALTETGQRQAAATGKALGEQFRFDHLFVSPFTRTTKTARIIAEQLPYVPDVIEDDRRREIDFGVLDGLTKHGIAHFEPGEMQRVRHWGSTTIGRRLARIIPMSRSGFTASWGHSPEKLPGNRF